MTQDEEWIRRLILILPTMIIFAIIVLFWQAILLAALWMIIYYSLSFILDGRESKWDSLRNIVTLISKKP